MENPNNYNSWFWDNLGVWMYISKHIIHPAAHEDGIKPVSPAAGLQSVIVSVKVFE